ncbi:hypothetical protein AG1IA_02934 [Rhizoctonia solani AG-1 IA]|uniref:Uncharacterized protein n=1 Tax=Thanatephorus cucumeris (strain AG1-IA) TaxID=983506 RepID=L8WY66_THACA|nr:hypothetical protein AG1IA_02934 [Rhizoctonia solani AG-1 IA]
MSTSSLRTFLTQGANLFILYSSLAILAVWAKNRHVEWFNERSGVRRKCYSGLTKMRLKFVALALTFCAIPSHALWCCCSQVDESSKDCCHRLGKGETFYSPKCGLWNGQTCDVGPDYLDQEKSLKSAMPRFSWQAAYVGCVPFKGPGNIALGTGSLEVNIQNRSDRGRILEKVAPGSKPRSL